MESYSMATRVRSYSKINLGLAIGPMRGDGFHGLATLYQTLALHDLVTVEARRLGQGDAADGDAGSETHRRQLQRTRWEAADRIA
jgi:4-diphosphocytidyl-2C-methyl-D-erythritol kinase